MSNYNNITARWDRGTLSEAIISRQYDDAATLVAFAGVPTGDDDEDAVYHLIVWMATEEGGEPHEQAPILLDAPEWLISNFYTQFTQVIRFQLCIQTEGGAYEAHSPIFSGRIARSLRHDGTTDDINTSVLFDPYKKYVDEKAMAAGAVVIDAALDANSTNPVQNKIVAGAITELNGRLDSIGDGVPSSVRQAFATLLTKALYNDTGLTDEKAVIQAWAAQVTAISISDSSASISGAGTKQLTATTTPAGGTVSWTSSDPTIASVSTGGLVTGVSNGVATITARSGDKTATCTVTVSGFATLTSISAVYTQTDTVNTTDSLDSLRDDLVVTGTYSDSSTATITDYTLSGTLTAGTSTITAAYGGKTDTFDVTVAYPNTTAEIATSGKFIQHTSTGYTQRTKANAGITILYDLDTPVSYFQPCGILATDLISSSTDALRDGSIYASLVAYDENGSELTYVNEHTGSESRWVQDVNGTMTEYVRPRAENPLEYLIYKYAFSVDTRYLDYSYIYDGVTGQVLFAGINTPYYGMHNISEASTGGSET